MPSNRYITNPTLHLFGKRNTQTSSLPPTHSLCLTMPARQDGIFFSLASLSFFQHIEHRPYLVSLHYSLRCLLPRFAVIEWTHRPTLFPLPSLPPSLPTSLAPRSLRHRRRFSTSTCSTRCTSLCIRLSRTSPAAYWSNSSRSPLPTYQYGLSCLKRGST